MTAQEVVVSPFLTSARIVLSIYPYIKIFLSAGLSLHMVSLNSSKPAVQSFS